MLIISEVTMLDNKLHDLRIDSNKFVFKKKYKLSSFPIPLLFFNLESEWSSLIHTVPLVLIFIDTMTSNVHFAGNVF